MWRSTLALSAFALTIFTGLLLFLLFGLFCVIFLVWLGMSRWGNIKLGDPDDSPEKVKNSSI